MALRYVVSSGLWSNTATWDGTTTLPQADDDVYLNGLALTIDQDVNVLSIRTTASGPAVAGGSCSISGNNRTIRCTGNGITAGTTNVINITNSTGTIIYADCRGGTSTNAYGVQTGNVADLIVYGNLYGGTTTGCHGVMLFANTGTPNGTIYGNCYGGSGNSAHALRCEANTGKVRLYGDTFGGTAGTTVHGCLASGGTNQQFIQYGNSTGGNSSTRFGTALGAYTIQIGNATGGSAAGAYGTDVGAGSRIIGNTLGGSNATAYGANINGGIHIGTARGSASAPGTHFLNAAGGFFKGNCIGGSASGAHGVNLAGYGVTVIAHIAQGTTSGAFGIKADTNAGNIIIIDREIGDFAKSIHPATLGNRLNYNWLPQFNPANTDNNSAIQTIQSMESGI